jgi:hypothetical protein
MYYLCINKEQQIWKQQLKSQSSRYRIVEHTSSLTAQCRLGLAHHLAEQTELGQQVRMKLSELHRFHI